VLRARQADVIALSSAVATEIEGVLARPKFRHVLLDDRDAVLSLVMSAAVWVEPAIAVHDCRDAKDNKYLELAMAAGADFILSSDDDLLVLNPWRGVRVLRPAEFLAAFP
jgi:uncharacterized protein